jgi:hypothetical protein
MHQQQEYDYTAKRLGSKQPPHGQKIIVCAKCGKRGTDDGILESRSGDVKTQMVTHRSVVRVHCGVALNHVLEHCSYAVTD